MVNRQLIVNVPQPPEMVLAERMLDGLFSDIFRVSGGGKLFSAGG